MEQADPMSGGPEKPPGAPPSAATRALPSTMPRPMRVAILMCDAATADQGRGDENFLYEGAEHADRLMIEAAQSLGHTVLPHYVHLRNVDAVVDALDCDVVLNLCDGSGEGKDGLPGVEAIRALERRGLAYSGAGTRAYELTSDKVRTKHVLRAAGVPVPHAQVFESADDPLDRELVGRRLIVKPSDSFGSSGIDLGSVVSSEEELRARVASMLPVYGPPLVEEYIDGREITVGLLGSGGRARALPPLEVCFGEVFPGDRRIRTHATKWDVHSPLYGGFTLSCPARLPLAVTRRCLAVARAAYLACDCTGYGRVDLRVDARGPFVLEVNANCSLEWGETAGDCAMLPSAAQAAGFSYAMLLQRLIDDALRMHAKRARAARAPRARRALTAR